MKIRSAFSFFFTSCLLIFSGCFQPVDLGKTIVEEGTAYIQVTNVSADDSYILDGLELRDAEGEVEQSWNGLDLGLGKSWEVHAKTSGSCTLWYRVKDLWISSSVIGEPYQTDPPAKIALNRSHEFSFRGEKLNITWRDNDKDGIPDAWETENGFNPEDPADGGEVYVGGAGRDEPEYGDGTSPDGPHRGPYRTLAKAVAKASRGLSPAARTVVVLNTLNWQSGNDHNPKENPVREDSVFYLGKTRGPVTIRGQNTTDPNEPGVLKWEGTQGKRVLYLGPGADVTLLNITVTGGKHTGGGIYVTGAKLTLGEDTTVTGNESYDATTESGGVYVERGELIMEQDSSITANEAGTIGGVGLLASRLTMNGGTITGNVVTASTGGLSATDSTIEMSNGAEITDHNGFGVALSYSTLIMHSGSSISRNTTTASTGSTRAGGIHTSGESFITMEEGSEISYNKCIQEASDTANKFGYAGGVFLGGQSTFIMKGGKITGNEAGNFGGGIVLSGNVIGGTTFTMEGGVIAGNKAGTTGGGIYMAPGSSFTLKRGTVYGKDTDNGASKNIAGAESDSNTGHAIYDGRTGTSQAYDTNVSSEFSL